MAVQADELNYSLLNCVPHAILVVKAPGKVVFANEQFRIQFPFSYNEIETQLFTSGLLADFFRDINASAADGMRLDVMLRDAAGNQQLLNAVVKPGGCDNHYFVLTFYSVRKDADEEKPDGQFRFKQLLESIPFGMVEVNEWDIVLHVNKVFLEMFGYEKEEVIGFDINHLIVPEELQNEGSNLSYTVYTGADIHFETRRAKKSGELIDVAITGVPVLSASGEKRVFGIYQNIAERRAVEAQLALKELEFSAMVAYLPGMVYRCDATQNYNMFFSSLGAKRVTGYTPEDFVEKKKPFNDIIFPECRADIWKQWLKCIENRTDFEAEYRIITADGKTKWVWERGRPIFNAKGEVLMLEGYIEDVDERRKTQDSLRRERDLLQALMDNIPDTIYFKDLESNFIRINKSQSKVLGLNDPSEAIGASDFDFFNKEHAEKAFEDEQKLMKTGIPVINKAEYLKSSGGWRWFTSTKVPLRNSSGKITGMVGVSRDITETKELESRLLEKEAHLIQINSEKDKLFSVIAHDLRSPFNSFLLLTEILAEESFGFDPVELKNLANSMHRAAKSVAELLENLLSWSGLQRGTVHYTPDFVKVDEIVKNNLDYYANQIQNKGLNVEVQVVGKLLVHTDAAMLGIILRNLISNAIKFTPHEGKIDISAGIGKNELWISIEDHGIGMPQVIVDHLFEFNSKGRKGTDGEPSSGLGLILVKEFTERLSGRLEVKSDEGKGSVFTIFLPVYKPTTERR